MPLHPPEQDEEAKALAHFALTQLNGSYAVTLDRFTASPDLVLSSDSSRKRKYRGFPNHQPARWRPLHPAVLAADLPLHSVSRLATRVDVSSLKSVRKAEANR